MIVRQLFEAKTILADTERAGRPCPHSRLAEAHPSWGVSSWRLVFAVGHGPWRSIARSVTDPASNLNRPAPTFEACDSFDRFRTDAPRAGHPCPVSGRYFGWGILAARRFSPVRPILTIN